MEDGVIEIRPARPEDRGAVEAVSAQIWDGDDYVPSVFDKWVADKTGEFALVCVNGEVAGFGKLTLLTQLDAWLEGLRMSKAYRGLGLAKMLTKYCLQKCRERGVRSLRLSTFVENHESLHIIETHGFQRIASFKLLTCQSPHATDMRSQAEQASSATEVEQALDRAMLQKHSGLLSFDFTFEPLTTDLIEQLLAERAIHVVRRDGRVTGLLILSGRHSKGNELSISYMQGETRSDLETLTDHALTVSSITRQNLIVMCPVDDRLMAVYLSKGFRKEHDSDGPDVFVYEHESTLHKDSGN